jgi:hypothetical protein
VAYAFFRFSSRVSSFRTAAAIRLDWAQENETALRLSILICNLSFSGMARPSCEKGGVLSFEALHQRFILQACGMHRLASRRTSPAPRERKRQSAFLRWSTHACGQLLDRGREQAIRGRSILQNNENGGATASQHTRIAARWRWFSNQKINTRNRRFGWYRSSTETVCIKIGSLGATFIPTPTAASGAGGPNAAGKGIVRPSPGRAVSPSAP